MTLRSHAPGAVAVVVCIAALAFAGHAVVATPLAAFAAQAPGQKLLFGLRAGLLLAATWACAERRTYRTLAVVAAAFVASLAARGLLLVLVPAALMAIAGAKRWAGPAALVACLLPSAWPSRAANASLPAQPAALVAHYRARGNLWRARDAALQWARTEQVPGAALLELARLDWALGQRREAARALGALRENAKDASIRARADALMRRWHLEEHRDGR